jgi:two-component system KDP operon response regulator KdpE
VWGEHAVGDTYNTRYVVAQIRRKLGDDPAQPRYIVNEPGVGYRLALPATSDGDGRGSGLIDHPGPDQ